MIRNTHKKFNGKNVFTDFKHHAKSWHNSKRLRARMLRQELKREVRRKYKNNETDNN